MAAASVLAGIASFACSGNTLVPGSLDDLEVRFLSGFMTANLMPIVPPDPIYCQMVLLAKNNSTTSSLVGVRVQKGEVVLEETDTMLGTISFSTTWDGILNPGEEDTVRLSKVRSPVQLFTPPCGQRVRVNLIVGTLFGGSKTFPVDSLGFTCVY